MSGGKMEGISMGKEFSPSEIAEMRSSFDLFDADGNGFISRVEIQAFMERFGEYPTDAELNVILTKLDKDGDGQFGFYDFAFACRDSSFSNSNFEAEAEIEDLRRAFQMACISNTEYITIADLSYLFRTIGIKVSTDDLLDLMSQADTNSDDRISFEEFVDCLKREEPPAPALPPTTILRSPLKDRRSPAV